MLYLYSTQTMQFSPGDQDTTLVTRLTPKSGDYSFMYGYFDKQTVDDNNQRVLVGRLKFFDREPGEKDVMELGYVPLEGDASSNKFVKFAKTSAFNMQQGTQAEWVGPNQVIYNIRKSSTTFAAVVQDLQTGEKREYPQPVYAFNRHTQRFASLSYSRLHTLRRGYGYTVPRRWTLTQHPADSGIWIVDVATGESKLLVSIFTIWNYVLGTVGTDKFTGQPYADNPTPHRRDYWWVNHLMFSRDGTQLAFLVRASPWLNTHSYKFSTLVRQQAGEGEMEQKREYKGRRRSAGVNPSGGRCAETREAFVLHPP